MALKPRRINIVSLALCSAKTQISILLGWLQYIVTPRNDWTGVLVKFLKCFCLIITHIITVKFHFFQLRNV